MRPVAVLLFFLASPLFAADPPKLSALHPAGLAIGAEATVEAIGATVWPVQAWCSSAALKMEALPEKGKLKISAPPDAKPGPVLIRLSNEAGCSESRIFVLGPGPDMLENPKNDRASEAQPVASLPATIFGVLERRGDVDFFRLSLKKGQTLSGRLEAYGLRSEIDPYLHLIAPDGRELVLASDSHNLDPEFSLTVETTGDHLLQISAIAHKASAEVSFAGDKDKVYRLRLQTDPIPNALPQPDSLEASPTPPIKAPHRLQGSLNMTGERDRYRIEAAAGTKLRVRVEARSLHLLTDPVLQIFKANGALLREVDDAAAKPDPSGDITVEPAGFFEVEIRERFGRAGMGYQLTVGPIVPASRASTTADSLILNAGKTAELTVNLTREDGHAEALELVCPDLPEGVTWKAEAIPAKTGPFKMTFSAEGTAKAFQGPFHLQLRPTGEATSAAPQPIVRTWQNEESRGDYLINATADFWMTVIAAPPAPSTAPAPAPAS